MNNLDEPNKVTSMEMILLSFGIGIFFSCLIATTWQAYSQKRRPLTRVYWIVCSSLMWVGIGGLAYFVAFGPEFFDQEGHVIGEMPPGFGLASLLVQLSLCGAILGFTMQAVAYAVRKIMRNKQSNRSIFSSREF